jgi:hypothetical protein
VANAAARPSVLASTIVRTSIGCSLVCRTPEAILRPTVLPRVCLARVKSSTAGDQFARQHLVSFVSIPHAVGKAVYRIFTPFL